MARGRRRVGRAAYRRLLSAAPLIVLLMILLLPGPRAGSPASAPAPRASPGPGPGALAGAIQPASAPRSGLPGANPAGERWIDAPQIAAAAATTPARPSPGPASILRGDPIGGAPPVVAAFGGTVDGYVYDYTYGVPISNATVLAEPFGLGACVEGQCSNTTTGVNGRFSLATPVGAVALLFSAPYYGSNQTWADLSDGGTADLGFVFLLHDAVATGTVESALPGHAPLAGVEVNASPRSGGPPAVPGAVTNSTGEFEIAVPPTPVRITLTPVGARSSYLANSTFVNLTPYGSVDLGVVHLEGGVPIYAELIDRATDLPVARGTPAELMFGSEPSGVCVTPAVNQTGANVSAFAMPGPTSVTAEALGYLVNNTSVPDIPQQSTPFDLGRIYLVPLGAAEISANLTGGTPPVRGWPPGNVTAVLCSLDSLQVAVLAPGGGLTASYCWPGTGPNGTGANTFSLGTTSIVLGPPLRDAVLLVPVSGAPPSFPIGTVVVPSGVVGFPASYANISWANLTPDATTLLGSVDVAPGEYLDGNVTEAGATGSLDGVFSVQACSTDASGDCGAAVLSSDLEPAVAGCPLGPSEFCVPAPPGPVQVTVTDLGPNTTNVSWVAVPSDCCAQSGHPLPIGTIGLPPADLYGTLTGTVVARTGGWGTPIDPGARPFGSVEACPVSPPTPGSPAPRCAYASINGSSGAFRMVAAAGWDRVTATSIGYQANWTWVFENASNSSGVLELSPDGYLTGTVLSALGGPVPGAVVSTCPVGTPLQCTVIARAGNDGRYNGTVDGGAYPWATYDVQAAYPGYITDWTFVNATSGAIVPVPTLVLPTLATPGEGNGTNASARPLWVTGEVWDARTGLPVRQAVVGECLDYSCTDINTATSYGGTFNLTWVAGEDSLIVSAAGYDSQFFPVAPSNAVSYSVGPLVLTAQGWLTGQVLIAPWESLANSSGLGASVGVRICPTNGPCGISGVTNSAGWFNVTTPNAGFLQYSGNGIEGYGTGQGGYDYGSVQVSAGGNYSAWGPVVAWLFVGVSGTLTDGTGSGGHANATRTPGSVVVSTNGDTSETSPYNASSVTTGPGGSYTFLLEGTAGISVGLTASATGYRSDSFLVNASLAPPGVAPVGATALAHDGYLTAAVTDSITGAAVSSATVVTSVADPSNQTTLVRTGVANGSGDLNLTTPASSSVSVTIDAGGYATRTFVVPIVGGLTTALGRVNLTEGAPPVGFFVRSAFLNTVGTPARPAVVDATTGAPLPGAQIVIANGTGAGVATVYSNGLGQFLGWVPANPGVALSVWMPSYDPWSTYYVTAGASRLEIPSINLTASGVVSGRVVLEPNGTGLYNTALFVCPSYSPGSCPFVDQSLGFTNLSGEFWTPAPPGSDVATVETEEYLANVTPTVGVQPRGFYDIGEVPVYAFAKVSGVVLGLPTGTVLPGANVSLCSPFGTPYGPCDTTVVAGGVGNFTLSTPPGTYVLVATAPGYNQSFRTITVAAGESVDVGAILLLADGFITGTVVSEFGDAPIANATVILCLLEVASTCTPYVRAAPNGSFYLFAPAGPAVLTASAPGYDSNYTDLVVPSGGTDPIGDVRLTPLLESIPESAAGTVTAAATGDPPVPGAFIALFEGTVPVGSTVTSPAGGFYVPVPWGTYTLAVSAIGYLGVRDPLVVHANLTGLRVVLSVRTFEVDGTVRDATTGAPIGDASILQNGTALATTPSNGTYRLFLPNGTYALEVEANSSDGVSYAPLQVSIDVEGGSVVHNLTLVESGGALVGLVVDATTGLPIPGATVSLTGGVLVGGLTASSTGTGAFRFSLPSGSYRLNVSAPGYGSRSVVVQVPSTGPVDVALASVLPPVSGGPGLSVLDLVVVGAAVAAVALGVRLVVRRRPPAAPEPPRWTLDDNDP